MECVNCESLYETNKFLLTKCGHPLCKSCLTQKKIIKADCFHCHNDISKGINDSFPNYLLVSPMMESYPMHQNCGICKESHPATSFCLDCDEAFCDYEAESHPRHRLFRDHKVIKIEEYHQYQKRHQHLGFLHHKLCTHHKRPYEFLHLETKTHNELLCSKCLTGSHTSLAGVGHCADLLHQKLEHIRELGSQGTAHLTKLCEEEEIYTSRLKGLEESRDRSLSEIRRVFDSIYAALRTRQELLEREVEELNKSAGFALSEERERSRVWQGQLSLLARCVEEIHVNNPPSDSMDSSSSSSIPPISEEATTSSSPEILSSKSLMVDACLLEDALRSSLSSSRASSSLTDVQSQLRVSKIRDQIEFTFHLFSTSKSFTPLPSSSVSSSSSSSVSSTSSIITQSELETLLHRISSMCSVISTSSCPFRFDWSKNKVQSVMTFYSYGNGANQLYNPYGMTYSPDSNNFYVCDTENRRIQVFRNHYQAEREGRMEIEFLPPLGSAGTSSSVSGVALNPPYTSPPSAPRPTGVCYHDGQLFIVDQNNHRVQVWRAEDGSFLRMIGTGVAGNAVGQFNTPWGCTVYQNHLFVSDQSNNRIQKFSLPDGASTKIIGSGGSGIGQLSTPRGLSVFNGKLYVADYSNHRISVFDPESGAALSVIGPSLLNDGNLSHPWGVISSHNLLFVSSNHRISVFDFNHNYLYSFGSNGSGPGQFSSPPSMVMVNDKLYICDISNRIQLFEQRLE